MNYVRRRRIISAIGFHVPAILLGFVMIYPLLWMVSSSLKTNSEVFTTVTQLIPSSLHFENYVTGWMANGRVT